MGTESDYFSSLKQWTKQRWASLLYGLRFVDLRACFSSDQALVLMYHRVLDETEISEAIHPGMYVTSKVFASQLEYLSKKYSVIRLEQLQEWMEGRIDFPKTPCVITLDDGWNDNYRNAFPSLRKFSLPATIFLVTGQIGEPEMMTWDQVKEMEAAGIAFGSHTVTHGILRDREHDDICREFRESKKRLQEELKAPSEWFCYPKGEYDQAAYELVKKFYVAALTTNRGPVQKVDDLFQIRRICIHNDVSMTIPLFACRLAALL